MKRIPQRPGVLRLLKFLPALVLLLSSAAASAQASAGFDFPPATFNILDAKTSKVIGFVRYSIGPIDDSGLQTVSGDEHYLDGEHDVERDVVQNRGTDKMPLMVTFEHDFYNADGSIARVSAANFRTGDASCTVYTNGHRTVLSDTLDFPSDTYAGAIVELPMQAGLRNGSNGPISLHAFNCIPGPKVIKIAAYPQAPSAWTHYAGETVEVSVKPDFGWLNFVVAPFMPEFRAWFNPASQWQFVGARFTRFYKGPEIILAYVPAGSGGNEAPPAAPSPPQLEQAERSPASISALHDDSGATASRLPTQ